MTALRTVFIDFDGTYADHGLVPPAHAAAVKAARAAGHSVYLCTGRPKSMVPAHTFDGVFDGLVAAAGGYVEVGGQVLADTRFPPELARQLIEVLDAHRVLYVLEAPEAVYARPDDVEAIRAQLQRSIKSEEGPREILAGLVTTDDLAAQAFGKITCFGAEAPLVEIVHELHDRVSLLPSSLPDLGHGAGELYLPEINKSVGIDVVVAHFGLDLADVIAIGDGLNDLEMVAHAGTGVAVKTAPPPLLAVADLLVDGPGQDGLVAGFAELGLT